MNANELLSRAQGRLDPVALRACRLATTDEAADFHYERPQRLAPAIHRACWLAFFIGTGLLSHFLANFQFTGSALTTFAEIAFTWLLSILAAAICVGGPLMWLSEEVLEPWSGDAEQPYLEKIAGTEYCEKVVQYLDESTWAKQWRDSALATRTELRRFDAFVMEALRDADAQDTADAQRRARYEAACKVAHGVA